MSLSREVFSKYESGLIWDHEIGTVMNNFLRQYNRLETIRCIAFSKGKCYFGKFYIQIYIQVSVCIVGLTVKHIYCGSWPKTEKDWSIPGVGKLFSVKGQVVNILDFVN